MKWKKTVKKIAAWFVRAGAAVAVVFIVLKHVIGKFSLPGSTAERDKKITDKIDDHMTKADKTAAEVEASGETVRDSQDSIKDNMADREEREGKFFR